MCCDSFKTYLPILLIILLRGLLRVGHLCHLLLNLGGHVTAWTNSTWWLDHKKLCSLHLDHGYIWPWSLELPCKKSDYPKAAVLERSRVGTLVTLPAEHSLPAILPTQQTCKQCHPGPCTPFDLSAKCHCMTSINVTWYKKIT